MKLFVSPHSDDSVLFGAFTLQREKPTVLTVYDSYVQVARGNAACDAATRRAEDTAAVAGVLGCEITFDGLRDDLLEQIHADPPRPDWKLLITAEQRYEYKEGCVRGALEMFQGAEEVWLPAVEKNGHEQHNLVGEVGGAVFKGAKIHRYLTYTRTGGKSIHGTEVKPTGAMVRKKLQALACYKTQIEIDALGCWPWFCDLREFVLD